jgi:Heparinase II/III N-terminus/Heparinase II/III-like protein
MSSTASIFLPPWAGLDDAALLAHYRAPRPVRYYPVADADETQPAKIAALLDGRFEFNGETHDLHDPVDWLHNPSRDVEWHILLHKFYYAVGLGLAFERSGDLRCVQRWVGLIDSWMHVTPPGFIAADVTGRRVQNWIYSLHLFVGHAAHGSGAHITPAFHRRLLQSLHEQVEYLCANLTEKRNHRTLELYAIFLAGVVLPEMQRAAHWRAFALEQTVANLQSDLLADGVHCELSTDYHHLVLKNALNFRRLAALNSVAVPPAFDAQLQRGLEFSLHVHKPDGIVPSLSDGDARGFLDLLQQGAELFGRADMLYVATQGARGTPPRERVVHFATSGYSIVRSDWGGGERPFADAQYLVFDSGPLGEGNHGHFDCLNFELAAFGRSLIVDPGRYTYSEAVDPVDGTNWRLHFRGTAAHNTVCVDGRQQTSYLPKPIKDVISRHASGSVRHKISGPPPDAGLIERWHGASLDLLHGRARSHEYDALHERCIVFVGSAYWIVSDWLRAPTAHEYRLNFQLGAQAQGQTMLDVGSTHRLHSPGLLMLQPAREGMVTTLQPGWVSARYGHKQAAPALQSAVHAADADFDTVLVPWSQAERAFGVEDLAVEARGATDGPPLRALRIGLQAGGQSVVDTWFHARGRSAASWHIGGLEFSGRWAHWRHSADGRLLHAISHAGASLPVPHEETHGRSEVSSSPSGSLTRSGRSEGALNKRVTA